MFEEVKHFPFFISTFPVTIFNFQVTLELPVKKFSSNNLQIKPYFHQDNTAHIIKEELMS